jgi:hypothetical protein
VIEYLRVIASRAYFALCLAAGRMLRPARYSTVRIINRDDERLVRKHRRFYAPLLIRMSDLLVRILNSGVRVLPQRDWEQRERRIYQRLYGASIQVMSTGRSSYHYSPGSRWQPCWRIRSGRSRFERGP